MSVTRDDVQGAQRVMEHVVCNQCGHDDTREVHAANLSNPDAKEWDAYQCTNPGYGQHYRIVQCQNCDLVYCDPRPSMDSINDNYEAVEDDLYLQERSAREITFAHHLKSLEDFTGPAEGRRLLDVGAYIGVFVEEALKSGWDAWGVEPSLWASQYAQEHRLNVVQGTLDTIDFKPESFDAMTSWDVIEHVPDPRGLMEQAYDLLKPGGWIALHTMDIDSLFAKVMGKRWPWLMEMHIYYFSKTTLANMMESVGFEVETVKPQGRYLSVQYVTTRLRPYSPPIADLVDGIARRTGLAKRAIPLNFGDLVTAFARKP